MEVFNDRTTETSDSPRFYTVRITEMLQKVVTIEACSPDEAEQIVSNNWRRSDDYVLTADEFTGVEFEVLGNDGDSV